MPRAPRDPTGRQEGEPPCSYAFPKTDSRPRRPARWEQSEPTTEGGQMDQEKKAEAIAAMADSLADFVIRTARDKDAPPEAVRTLPEAAKVALDLLDYC